MCTKCLKYRDIVVVVAVAVSLVATALTVSYLISCIYPYRHPCLPFDESYSIYHHQLIAGPNGKHMPSLNGTLDLSSCGNPTYQLKSLALYLILFTR